MSASHANHKESITGLIIALFPLSFFLYFASLIGKVSSGEVLNWVYVWVPNLDINISFRIDGLSLIFALLISGIGTLIVIYASSYLVGHHQLYHFYVYLILFMLSMLGVVLADNMIFLFICWELTSISSYLLIGFNHEESESRFSATQALLVTGAGGLILMAGLILIRVVSGSWELSDLLHHGEAGSPADLIRSHSLYGLILFCALAGAFTKSAQVPFHFWLPGAMAAPTPVSAYLHSATMVKAGVYLLARFNPILGHTEAWLTYLVGFGSVTMFVAAYIAWRQTDLKRILAYSTVSALGLLVMLIGLGEHLAIEAAIVFLMVHSLYKGSLFMVAGAIDHETGTRDIRLLNGLRRAMPITAVAASLAALSMSGFPPFFGFIGKELIYESTLEAHSWAILLTIVAVLTNILTILAAGLVAVKPFWGELGETPKHPHTAPWRLWLGPVLMASLGLIFGVLINMLDSILITPAVEAVLGESVYVKLSLWHGFTLVLLLSGITIGGGIGLYLIYGFLQAKLALLDPIGTWGPGRWYQYALQGLDIIAKKTTGFLQNGYLRNYILFILLTTLALVGYAVLTQPNLEGLFQKREIQIQEVAIALIMIVAAFMAVMTQSRLMAIASLGVVGFGVSLMFIFFSAPDLAMTQFSIETLSVILIALVLTRLPRYRSIASVGIQVRDAIIAGLSGIMVTLLILMVQNFSTESRLTPFFAENAYKLAHGQNIVNVILVDFRGIDTMGEITVLTVAAVGVFALLRLRLGEDK